MYWKYGEDCGWQPVKQGEERYGDVVSALSDAHIDDEAAGRLVHKVRRHPLIFYRFYDLYEVSFARQYQSHLFWKPGVGPRARDLGRTDMQRDWRGYVLLPKPGIPNAAELPHLWLEGDTSKTYAINKRQGDTGDGPRSNLCFDACEHASREEKVFAYLQFFSAFMNARQGAFLVFREKEGLEGFLDSHALCGREPILDNFIHKETREVEVFDRPGVPFLDEDGTTPPKPYVVFESGRGPAGDPGPPLHMIDTFAIIQCFAVYGAHIYQSIFAVQTDESDAEKFGHIRMMTDEPYCHGLFIPLIRFSFEGQPITGASATQKQPPDISRELAPKIGFIDFDKLPDIQKCETDLRKPELSREILRSDDTVIIRSPVDLVTHLRNMRPTLKSPTLGGVGKYIIENLIVACEIDFDNLPQIWSQDRRERFASGEQYPPPSNGSQPHSETDRQAEHDERIPASGATGPSQAGPPEQSEDASSSLQFFRHHLQFSNILFLRSFRVDFQKCDRGLEFKDCVFLDDLGARHATIVESFKIKYCTFARNLDLEGLRVHGRVRFLECRFMSDRPKISMRNSRVRGNVILEGLTIGDCGLIDASLARIGGQLCGVGIKMGCKVSNEDSTSTGETRQERILSEPARIGSDKPVYGVHLAAARISGGLRFGASVNFRTIHEERSKVAVKPRSKFEIVRDLLGLSTPMGDVRDTRTMRQLDPKELIESAFLKSGWIGTSNWIDELVEEVRTKHAEKEETCPRIQAPPDEAEGRKDNAIGYDRTSPPIRKLELVRNVICGDVVLRSATIHDGADFTGIRIIEVEDECLGDLNLTHAQIWGNLDVSTTARYPNPHDEHLENTRDAKIVIAPTDIDGYLAAQFLRVHGNAKLHGPKSDRIFDELWAPEQRPENEPYTFRCLIDLQQCSFTYLHLLLDDAGHEDVDELVVLDGTGEGDGISHVCLRFENLYVTESFTNPLSFSRIGRGVDFRHSMIEGHLDLTNLRTNLCPDVARNRKRDRLSPPSTNRSLADVLEECHERNKLGAFDPTCRPSKTKGRCEIRLADAHIGGDLRMLSDRKDGTYERDIQLGDADTNGQYGNAARQPDVPAMNLRTVCTRLDMETTVIRGDAHLSGLEVRRLASKSRKGEIAERRSGAVYAVDARVSGQITLEREDTYYGRPKRAQIDRELSLNGAKATELMFSATVFPDSGHGAEVNLETAQINHLRISPPAPLFVNLSHITVRHWDLPSRQSIMYSDRGGRRQNVLSILPNCPQLKFWSAVSTFSLWFSTFCMISILLLKMGGLRTSDWLGAILFSAHTNGLVLALLALSIAVKGVLNLNDSHARSFGEKKNFGSWIGFISNLLGYIALPIVLSISFYFLTEAGLSPPGAALLSVLILAALWLYPHLPFDTADVALWLVTGRRWINFCLKAEEIRRDRHLPRTERRYPDWLSRLAGVPFTIYPQLLHTYDWVSDSPFIALLTKSRPFQADAYAQMSETLRTEGKEGDSERVLRSMKHRDRRESAPVYRDFIGATWRFWFERLIISPFLGYGTRYWTLVLAWLVCLAVGLSVFTIPEHVMDRTSEKTVSVIIQKRGAAAVQKGEGGARKLECHEYVNEGIWLAFRYTVPLISIIVEPRIEPGPEKIARINMPGLWLESQHSQGDSAFRVRVDEYTSHLGTNLLDAYRNSVHELFEPTWIRPVITGLDEESSWQLSGEKYVFGVRPVSLLSSPAANGVGAACTSTRHEAGIHSSGAAHGGNTESAVRKWLTPRNIAKVLETLSWIIWPLFIAQLTGLIRWRTKTS